MSFVASVKHIASSIAAESANAVKDVEKVSHSKTVEADFAKALDEAKAVSGSAGQSSSAQGIGSLLGALLPPL